MAPEDTSASLFLKFSSSKYKSGRTKSGLGHFLSNNLSTSFLACSE